MKLGLRRPRRRDPSGGMSANDFIKHLQAYAPAAGLRQTHVRFQKSLGGPRGGGSVYVNYVNLPPGVGSAGGGAEAENNRASFWVHGFAYDPSVPVERVKVEQSNNVFHRAWMGAPAVPFRARSGTPHSVAHYLGNYLGAIMDTVPPRFTHTRMDPSRWSPPALTRRGIHGLELDILEDLGRPRIARRLYPGKNVPVDRAYKSLEQGGFVRWTASGPPSEHGYHLTRRGVAALRLHGIKVRALGRPAQRDPARSGKRAWPRREYDPRRRQ